MWYSAEILFAEPQQADRAAYRCDSSNVVFGAATAADAYRKAVIWGQNYAAEPPTGMQFLGVPHLTTIGDRLRDGVEICGRLFDSEEVWDRIAELVPSPES